MPYRSLPAGMVQRMRALGLKRGLKAGLDKIEIHLEKALVGDYPLLGAGEFPNHVFAPS